MTPSVINHNQTNVNCALFVADNVNVSGFVPTQFHVTNKLENKLQDFVFNEHAKLEPSIGAQEKKNEQLELIMIEYDNSAQQPLDHAQIIQSRAGINLENALKSPSSFISVGNEIKQVVHVSNNNSL